ncbi:MAG: Sapep family Mn(2+)-dependent dipeptidase [Oscillospiraceae bacterium]|nr:Sapep family Mn(2+)-dependent dipeptidase [Oscillospiraceae bacterium]
MINELVDKNFEKSIEFLSDIISVRSIGDDPCDGKPYGENCALVLEKFLQKADSEGFITRNIDNYAGSIEFNDKPVKLAVLCHLDVVPVNEEDWTHKPFCAEVDGDRIYGRGAIDNKGPAAAVLYALKAIKESGTELTHNVRLIVGCDEERGSSDMEYYMSHEKMPELVFTPDGDYPVINIEKGMLRTEFTKNADLFPISGISGGVVVNAVPPQAKAVIKGLFSDKIKSLPESERISVSEAQGNTIVTYTGTAAHASTPQLGDNAITGLLDFLCKSGCTAVLGMSEQSADTLKFLHEHFVHSETDGKSLGIKASDEKSGALTEVLSIISYKDNIINCKMDIRYPLCTTKESIKEKLLSLFESGGFEMSVPFENDPHYVDENSEFIKTLLRVYHEQTGNDAYCKAIGGGTYVHDIPGGVAFGAEFPGDVNNMHGNDESITLESLKLNTKIIANAIYEICK